MAKCKALAGSAVKGLIQATVHLVCVIRFRSDPDHWARYFRVQRMIVQLDRVEREKAEKQAGDKPQPPARLAVIRKSPTAAHRPASSTSAVKVLVFGTESVPPGTDPSPLLSASQRTELSLKPSRSAGGRLDVCCGAGSTDSPPYVTAAPGERPSRAHSCDESAEIARQADKLKLKRSPKSTTMLQVYNV